MKITIIPQKNLIRGRTVDVVKSEGGLTLPEMDTRTRGVTIFVLIDAVGPDVTRYKPGQIVLPHNMNHIFVRGGFHQVILTEDEVWGVVEGIEERMISIGGAKPVESGNERVEVEGAPA